MRRWNLDGGPYAAFLDDVHLRVGDEDFHCQYPLDGAPPDRLPVMKPRNMVEQYIQLCRTLKPRRIVELGIRRGGSTALLSELTAPDILVAVELTAAPAPALTDYIERRRLAGVIRPYYGVDQADRERLSEIVDQELGGKGIDLVVDDASHLFEPTRASFEALFPHLREGGVYVIEDWSWQHVRADRITERLRDGSIPVDPLTTLRAPSSVTPLTRFAVELLLARASASEVIDEVTAGRHWVVARRGPEPLGPGVFRVSELYTDHFGLLAPLVDS